MHQVKTRVAVIGYGIEGKSVRRFLRKDTAFKNARVSILDQKRDKNYLKKLENYDVIFRSPGVPWNQPEIRRARKRGVEVTSATKLFFDRCKNLIIGVTGSKGKSTTSSLIYKILKAAGKSARLAGNIGRSPLDLLPILKPDDIVVLELSSFQLWDLKKSPSIAVVLDVFPDHQDVHRNLKEYYNAKANLVRRQKKDDVVFYFSDNPLTKAIAKQSPAKKFAVEGYHLGLNKNNAIAAAVTCYLGIPKKIIERTAKNFRGLEYRFELIRIMRSIKAQKQNSNVLQSVIMLWYNDSAATNPRAAAITVETIAKEKKTTILIAGGRDKNLDYAPMKTAIQKSGLVKQVILFGENKNKIKQSIGNAAPAIAVVDDLRSAVSLAYKSGQSLAAGGRAPVAILFCPASASFDMFSDYKDRGKKFSELVKRLKT